MEHCEHNPDESKRVLGPVEKKKGFRRRPRGLFRCENIGRGPLRMRHKAGCPAQELISHYPGLRRRVLGRDEEGAEGAKKQSH